MAQDPYPVALPIQRPESSNRLWAIPFVGFSIKLLILIPHWIVLYVLLAVTYLAHLVIWIPVLFTGKYPEWGFSLTAGVLRWATRLVMYLYGLTDEYPAFGMDTPGDLVIAAPPSSSRFWAIPVFGILIKYAFCIPHLIIVGALVYAVGFIQLVVWIPVLFGGTYPAWAFQLTTGTYQWAARMYAYLLGLTDRYPPFSFT